MNFSTLSGFGFKFKGDGSVVVDSLLFVAPIVYEGFVTVPCFVMNYLVPS